MLLDDKQNSSVRRKRRMASQFDNFREELERLQARLNGRDPGDLLDEIEAEGFEPEGWSFEVSRPDENNPHNNASDASQCNSHNNVTKLYKT